MTQQHEKISENKTPVTAAHHGGGTAAVQLKNNRDYPVIQQKLAERSTATQQASFMPVQRKANNTGLPENLKSGIENLSGHSMDDVKVHYNSDKPAQLNAHAYAQGSDIHITSGQEKHLPHEAWHVVQQKQGRVKPTLQMKGKVNVNDDTGLEKEADVMGARALQTKQKDNKNTEIFNSVSQKMTKTEGNINSLQKKSNSKETHHTVENHVIQRVFNPTALDNFDTAQRILTSAEHNYIAMDHSLDGNRVNWGFSHDTWDTLHNNITIKSNHIRGQGVADALESLSWNVSDHPRSVRGPGGGAGIDLRLFTSGGIGGSRMDIEIKHANTIGSVRDQINAAVIAHGRNQTIKIYKNPAVATPAIDDAFVRAPRNYTFRGLGYAGDEDSARIQFYNDTNPTVLVATRVVSWN
jgi:hypothetical protein